MKKVDATPGTFGWRIRKARIEQGLSQLSLARRAGLSPGVVSRWELGYHSGCNFESVSAIAKVLDVSLDYLAGFRDDFGSCPVYNPTNFAYNLTKQAK